MSNDIKELRNIIDDIDYKIIKLFEERMETSIKIAKYKKDNNLPIYNKEREDEVISNNLEKVKNIELKKYTEDLLRFLMEESKKYQHNINGHKKYQLSIDKILRVGYQGREGSYSEQALIEYFGEKEEKYNYKNFEDVFKALKYSEIDYGILPIENTSTGSITQVYDLLKKYGYYIVGETKIKIEHYLLGIKDANINDIKEIYSHYQGFEQCSEYLSSLTNTKQIPYYNTAISAKHVHESGDKTKACVCSKRNAQLYNLEVLKENINNIKENYTRFIIIGRELESNENCDKMTILFTINNKPGTLYKQLEAFHNKNVNMLKIESRPFGDGSFCYYFYIDVEGNLSSENIKNCIDLVFENSLEFRILGTYKKIN